MLEQMVSLCKKKGSNEQAILEKFLDFTDSILVSSEIADSSVKQIAEYGYRIRNRLPPREVYRFGGGATSHAEGALLADFLTNLQDFTRRHQLVGDLEKRIDDELLKLNSKLGSNWSEALLNAGVWLDIPKQPKFEDINVLVSGESAVDGVQIAEIFPISQRTQAYTAFRYYVRIFAFSEHCNATETAAKIALQKVMKIKGDQFYKEAKRSRT